LGAAASVTTVLEAVTPGRASADVPPTHSCGIGTATPMPAFRRRTVTDQPTRHPHPHHVLAGMGAATDHPGVRRVTCSRPWPQPPARRHPDDPEEGGGTVGAPIYTSAPSLVLGVMCRHDDWKAISVAVTALSDYLADTDTHRLSTPPPDDLFDIASRHRMGANMPRTATPGRSLPALASPGATSLSESVLYPLLPEPLGAGRELRRKVSAFPGTSPRSWPITR